MDLIRAHVDFGSNGGIPRITHTLTAFFANLFQVSTLEVSAVRVVMRLRSTYVASFVDHLRRLGVCDRGLRESETARKFVTCTTPVFDSAPLSARNLRTFRSGTSTILRGVRLTLRETLSLFLLRFQRYVTRLQ